jgi:hypothetical protein
MKLQALAITILLSASAIITTSATGTSHNFLPLPEKSELSTAAVPAGRPIPAPTKTPKNPTPQEEQLETRDSRHNGIRVGEPEVYDDSMLQQMLREVELKLASMQLLDQGLITQRYGSVSGASQQISSFGLSVQGPSLPGVTTTQKGATGSIVETDKIAVSGTGQASSENTVVTTTGSATGDTVTTRAQLNPPSVSAPAPTTALPSGFSVSSSRILNEQMQLATEAQMLRLLLRGSLSSHFIKPGAASGDEMFKLKTTLGFPITINADPRFKDAVAIVEVEVEKLNDLHGNEKPMITALLPQEKTYNVAAITDKSTSIGGGLVTQVLGVSGSWLRGHKTYYLTQDQDTVALSFKPADGNRIGFRWQFRPVLGRRFVQDGLKRNFVQLAFPAPLDAKEGEIGKIRVRTYWRRYDYKKGVVKEIVPNSLVENVIEQNIPRYKLNAAPMAFSHTNLENLGGGQMQVNLFGRFLPGTYVRIGTTIPPITSEYYFLRFTAPINDLATKTVNLVAPDGTETPLEIKRLIDTKTARPKPTLKNAVVTTVDDVNSKVTVELEDRSYLCDMPRLIMVIGGRVFGYSVEDKNPTSQNCLAQPSSEQLPVKLSAVVPTSHLIDNPRVTVTALFAPAGWSGATGISAYNTFSRAERLVLMEQEKDSAGKNIVKFLLYGNRLRDIKIVNPVSGDATLQSLVPDGSQDDTLRVVKMTSSLLQENKYLMLQRGDERPFPLLIPPIEIKAEPKPLERVSVNADEVIVEGVDFKDLDKVTFKGKVIDIEPTEDNQAVRLKGLRASGVTANVSTQLLIFLLKSGAKASMKLEVVSGRVETVTK